MIIAFAGRRVDAPNAKDARFPSTNVPVVADRVREEFQECGATAIVSSAACGADLLALEAAGELGTEWGSIFDRIVDDVEDNGDLRILGRTTDDDAAYAATNEAILDMAEEVAEESDVPEDAVAVIAWNGQSRGDVARARDRGR